MNIEFLFVPPGSVLQHKVNQICVDVGNDFGVGMFDHHQPNAPNQCATELVYNHPNFIALAIDRLDSFTVITHSRPDLDALSASWLVKEALQGKEFNLFHKELAQYVGNIDRGYDVLIPDEAFSRTFISLYEYYHFCLNKLRPNSDIAMLELWHGFLSNLLLATNHGVDFFNLPKSIINSEWCEIKTYLTEDAEKFVNDLKNCGLSQKPFPAGNNTSIETVIYNIERPRSKLFKSWLRGHHRTRNPLDREMCSIVWLKPNRCIISVPPYSQVTLKGLGQHLEQLELAKREILNCQRIGENRPGFDNPDPWYDGRNSMHNFTIIDSPMIGTVLDNNDITQAINTWLEYC